MLDNLIIMTKICTKCGETKELSEFNKRKSSKFGVRADCKLCRKEIYEKYSKSFNGLIIQTYNGMRSRIKQNKVKSKYIIPRNEFYILAHNSNILNRLYINWIKNNYNNKYAPSVDRINNNLGYIKNNIHFITQSDNSKKGQTEKQQARAEKGEYKFPTKYKKWCNKCGQFIDRSLFHKCKSIKDGLNYYCKECKSIYYFHKKLLPFSKKEIKINERK